jgi:cytidine deaminase
MESNFRELLTKAVQAYETAYAPYSKYKVGSAVLWDSGRITTGSNVENASYGLTVCAERNAIFQGAALGERRIKAIAIAVPDDEHIPAPCGSCRQVLREFSTDCIVLLINGKGEHRQTSLQTLLPESFGPEFLT